MKLSTGPIVPGNAQAERFDTAVRKMLTVPKDEAELKSAREKTRAGRTSP